jgi:hypothetical protein
MADFTITVSNSINVFSLAPATEWNEFNWGTGFWGYGSNSIPFEVEKILTTEALTLLDAFSKEPEKVLENSISASFEMVSETLQDSQTFYEVFTRPTTEAENRSLTTFTEDSDTTTSWTEDDPPASSWSEE